MVSDKFLDMLRESLEKRIQGPIKVYRDNDNALFMGEAGNGIPLCYPRIIIEVNNIIRWRYSIMDDFHEDKIDPFIAIEGLAPKIVESFKKSLLGMALKGE